MPQLKAVTARATRHGSRTVLVIGIPALLLSLAPSAQATPLSLAQTPLFLSAHVPANIFFLDDDSGSMDWQMVTIESSGLNTGVMMLTAGGNTIPYSYVFPDADNYYGPSTFTTTYGRILPDEDEIVAASNMPADAFGVWRGRYFGYNKIYYNPDVNYKPWPGVDSAGSAFPDYKAGASLTAVRLNPYLSSVGTVNLTTNWTYTALTVPRTNGTTVDLSISLFPATYYTWTDSNGNGVVDAADAHTRYEIRTSGCSAGATCPSSFTRPAARVDCATANADGTRACTATEELQNFANWYSYYRRRDLAARGAIASVIAPKGAEVRMGHATLFGDDNSTTGRNIQVAQMASSLTAGAKRALLDSVYRKSPSDATMRGSTPLRSKFDQVGKYFACTSGAIFSSYTCPILSAANGGTCQQNFAIMMTDGYYNDSFSGLGNTDADGNSPDAAGNTTFDGGAYADTYSDTLADLAMRYYERDLSSLANNVPVIAGVDDASHQHLNTYAVGFGVTGTLTAGPTDPAAAFAWPDPSAGDLQKIDDLRHATYNGRGQFFSASDPDALSAALQSAVNRITELTGSASAVAVNSRSLSTNTRLYQGRFTSGEWSGDLRAISIDATTGAVGGQVWSAKTQLKSQQWDSGRSILTYRRIGAVGSCGAASGSEGGVAFRWSALSTTQQCLLDDNPATSAFDGDGKSSLRVNYLRGDTSEEGQGANFRTRLDGYKLGDIVNSSPIFVGAPAFLPELESVSFADFRNANAGRIEMLYVGANDGMLHGFDAATGNEKLAYVPSMVYPSLSKLTDPAYSHRYYVDGSPAVSDAFGAFGPTHCGGSLTSCWRTVLAGGLAGGGAGIYALDVTDPDDFSEANAGKLVLWEFLDSTTAVPGTDMGGVYGEIAIARMKNGQWAAIFGNGYNSTNENAALYIVNIVDGALIAKIVLNPYSTATGNGNGLSAPAVVDVNGDYIADYIYAGDLRGNLWKIDVTNSNPSNWASAYKQGSTPKPLFAAIDGTTATTVAQAITERPEVGSHPDGKGGYMVYFGTGRYIADGDKTPASSPINSFYGIWDKNTNSGSTPVARADLLTQTISQGTAAGQTVRTVSNNAIDWKINNTTGTHLGWVLNLRTDQTDSLGEMSVSNPVLLGGTLPRLIFTTLIPENSACSFGGSSWLMEISPRDGGNLDQDVFDIDGDGVANSNDRASGTTVSGISPGIGIMPEPVILRDSGNGRDFKILTGSKGDVKSQKNFLPTTSGGRQSWRQLK